MPWPLLGAAGATLFMLTSRRELPQVILSSELRWAPLCLLAEILARLVVGALAATVLGCTIGAVKSGVEIQLLAVVAGWSERYVGRILDVAELQDRGAKSQEKYESDSND